jgi:hypothetical protein
VNGDSLGSCAGFSPLAPGTPASGELFAIRHGPIGWCHHACVDVDELYGLSLDRFTAERNALSRALKQAGERERAAEVAALRKPSVAAWAVNQLVRTQKRGIGELFKAGDALRKAQDGVLAGRGDRDSLRAGVERERAAVQALTEAAGGLLSSSGQELSATVLDRVADTLNAAALDDDARAQVRDGRLERELRHVGLGMAAGFEVAAGSPAPARSRQPAGPSPAPAGRSPAPARNAARALREQEQARAQERAAARALEREARRRVEHAERGAQLALERRDRAAQALEAAEAELADAEEELREATAQLSELSQ